MILRHVCLEVEVDRELPELRIPLGYRGVALVVRKNGYPIGYFVKRLAEGSLITSETVNLWLAEAAAVSEPESVPLKSAFDFPGSALPMVTFAICTRNRGDLLRRCLKSITALETSPDISAFEILVVDNAPADESTKSVAAEFPTVRYVVEPRLGLSIARNRAAREAKGDFVAYIDDDAQVDAGWLKSFSNVWRVYPRGGGFGGPIIASELNHRAQVLLESRGGFGHCFRRLRSPGAYGGSDETYPCGGCYGSGANLVIRRDVLFSVGMFDEALGAGTPTLGGEDLEICYRILRAGYEWINEPGMLVRHQHRQDYSDLKKVAYSWGRGYMAYLVRAYSWDTQKRGPLRRVVAITIFRKTAGVVASLFGLRASRWPAQLALAEWVGALHGTFATASLTSAPGRPGSGPVEALIPPTVRFKRHDPGRTT